VVFVVLSIFLFKGLDRDPTELPSALVGETFPMFTLPALNQQRLITEQDLKSQVTLVNVWATWCFACRIEHPMLNQLAEEGVAIVGLNYRIKMPRHKAGLNSGETPIYLILLMRREA